MVQLKRQVSGSPKMMSSSKKVLTRNMKRSRQQISPEQFFFVNVLLGGNFCTHSAIDIRQHCNALYQKELYKRVLNPCFISLKCSLASWSSSIFFTLFLRRWHITGGVHIDKWHFRRFSRMDVTERQRDAGERDNRSSAK